MVVVVTGTPGTGKTFVAKKIAKKLKLEYIDVNRLIKEKKLYEKYDRKFKSYVVDVKKLSRYLIELIKKNKNIVLDSHLSHYLDKKYVDLCVICKCDLKILKKRLEKRKYSKEKIRENLDSEIFDVCLVEALEKGHKVRVIDTSEGVKEKKLEELLKR